MVARLVRDQEVVGSSPVTSTKKRHCIFAMPFLYSKTRKSSACMREVLLMKKKRRSEGKKEGEKARIEKSKK